MGWYCRKVCQAIIAAHRLNDFTEVEGYQHFFQALSHMQYESGICLLPSSCVIWIRSGGKRIANIWGEEVNIIALLDGHPKDRSKCFVQFAICIKSYYTVTVLSLMHTKNCGPTIILLCLLYNHLCIQWAKSINRPIIMQFLHYLLYIYSLAQSKCAQRFDTFCLSASFKIKSSLWDYLMKEELILHFI